MAGESKSLEGLEFSGMKYHIINIDPYLDHSFYIEPAFAAIHNGGLLCMNFTDGSSLCGQNRVKASQKYECYRNNQNNNAIEVFYKLIFSI